MKTLTILLLTIIIVSSCKKETDIIIPSEIADHYNSFILEAAKHGYKKINQKKFKGFILMGNITAITTGNVPAAAFYDHQTKFIYIDTTSLPYKYNREPMIYHELGHAILRRDHWTGNFHTGEVISIMDANSLPDYTGQFGYKRQYYVDELFIMGTPFPSWAH